MVAAAGSVRRLSQHLTAQALTAADNFLVMGDFNLSDNSRTFAAAPATGLPAGFALGADIAFPVAYSTDAAFYFRAPAVTRIRVASE